MKKRDKTLTRKKPGRKPLDPDGSVVVGVRMTAAQKATFELLGGAEWLRQVLQAHVNGQRDLFTKSEGQ